MRKHFIVLYILLLPNTLFCADYFMAPNCSGFTDSQGSVNQNRLSSCVYELIDGINKTRQAIDAKNNETQMKVDDVDYTIKSMNLKIRDLANNVGVRVGSERNADLAIDAIIAKMQKDFEERDREKELMIKQLEARIATLEKSLSEIQPTKPITGK